MAVKTFIGKIVENRFISHKVKYCKIEHIQPQEMDFIAGQYFSIMIDKGIIRAYSIGSSPENKNYLETYVDISPGGKGSKFFENSKIGDELKYFGPQGRFVYEEADNPALFISAGTGLTPFISMIEYAINTGTKRKIKLLQGTAYQKDLFLQEKLEEFKSRYSNFEYTFCISREEIENCNFGRVTNFIEQEIQDLGKNLTAYICGWKDMILDVEKQLLFNGVDQKNILYEKYF